MSFISEFKEFALKGSVVDLAVGVVIGAASKTLIDSLVSDIIMPPLSLLLGKVDFSNLFVPLNGEHYDTLDAAKKAGAPTLNLGVFLNNCISFFIIALAIFVVVKQINRLRRMSPPPAPNTKECPFCASNIPIKATRCPNCTSQLSATT